MKIAYFGDEFSHTYACASAVYQSAEKIGFSTVRAALDAVQKRTADLAVVPLENSLEGTVTESLDSIAEKSLFITAEHVCRIHQNLVGLKGADVNGIKTVYSHPQALSQCRRYLEKNLPKAKCEAVAYTSLGVSLITDFSKAAVARVNKEGTEILDYCIEDSKHNATRFVSASCTAADCGNKASLVFGTQNKPGALLSVLSLFHQRGLNLTKIESRPDREKLGAYVFYADFMFDGAEETLQEVITALKQNTTRLQFLGRYAPANEELV